MLCATTLVIAENTRSNKVSWDICRPFSFAVDHQTRIILVGTYIHRRSFCARNTGNGITKAVRAIVPLLAVIAITVVILTIFRTLYFGYPLPNTYYAKVSPSLSYNFSQGVRYFTAYSISDPIVWAGVLAAFLTGVHSILTFAERKFTHDGLLFLPVIAAIGLSVPIITGGDHFGSFRFYQGVYPICVLCLVYFLKSVLPQYIRAGPPIMRLLRATARLCS